MSSRVLASNEDTYAVHQGASLPLWTGFGQLENVITVTLNLWLGSWAEIIDLEVVMTLRRS